MKSGFLEQLIRRIDRIDPGSLQTHILGLAREKGLLDTILATIREGLIVVDGQARIRYANAAVSRLLGLSPERMEGRKISEAVPALRMDALMGLDPEAWSHLMNREIEVTYPEHRFLELYLVPMQVVEGAGEDSEGAVILLRDVTREREKQESTLESERLQAINLLAAGVAHEIGNPLNSLNIHLQLMERELRGVDDGDTRSALEELLEVSRGEIARLDQIIHSFLRALRPSEPQREPVQVDRLLQDILKTLQREVSDRGVWVETEFPEDVPVLSLDKGQMQQAFHNILRNGLQAMTRGGVMTIGIRISDRWVALSFRDTGSGIKPEDIGMVFEPFHTTKPEGTGLGLMIVQRILRDHGGQIEIDTRPEQGTTITLLLPRHDERIRLLAESPGSPA
jgi:two-component system, sporulation sensor kinase E